MGMGMVMKSVDTLSPRAEAELVSTAANPPSTGGAEVADLKGKTLRGGVVATVVQFTNFAIRTGSTIVLARLLTPHDFGLVAMVTGVTGFFELLKDAGLSMATVQRETITHAQISTLFWVNVLVGVVLAAFSAALAPALVKFYHEPRLLWLTVVLAGQFLLIATGVQHRALLQRRMQFVTLGAIEILSLVTGVVTGLCMAFWGFGYWALVGMSLSTAACQTVCLWVKSPWVPGLPQRGCGIRSMLHFGGTVTCNTLVVYVAYNADKILLGRFCGAESLGLYSRAQTLINLPTQNLNSAIGSVALPALSRLQDDPVRLKRYFLQGYALVLSATIPITLICCIFAEELIRVMLGARWAGAVAPFRILAPTALALALVNPFGWLLFAKGQTVRSLLMALFIAPLLVSGYLIGIKYGPTGVAAAYSAVMAMLVAPLIMWAKAGGTISLREVLQTSGNPMLAGVVSGAVAFGCKAGFGIALPSMIRLALGGCIMACVYFWFLLVVLDQKRFYFDVLGHLVPRWKLRSRE
jgi:O-antigen/teichoic acid export membrane protein